MKNGIRNLIITVAVAFCAILPLRAGYCAESSKLNLYAGAGLKKAMDVVIDRFQKTHGVEVVPNYGPSGGLYTQISKGQPCDIFFSADWVFIEKLRKENLLQEGKKYLTDSIVLVVSPSGEKKIHSLADLKKPGIPISIADPRAPVGRYAEEGLKKLGIWEKIVEAGNVKAKPTTVNQVAIMVQKDQVDGGFIFKSVANMYGLKYVAEMKSDLTGEIVFGIGIIKNGNESLAGKFMAFAAGNVEEFTKYGWAAYE